jgi:eukaryotic-like serine/threonine-protein kinase
MVVPGSGWLDRREGRVTQVDEGPESPAPPGVLTFGAPTLGEVLAERYELQEHINNDAFGRQVWRGVDVILRRPVAVVMRYPGGDSAVEMLDAAVAASRVVHPHLVDVYDAIDEGTRAYVVREWVDGGSLREYVADSPLDATRATSVTSAIASAVAAMHATGMAHGNVHPGTVLIGSDGRVVLSDARADVTTTPDADVRAVGAVLYCALTGHWPRTGNGTTGLPDAPRDEAGLPTPPRAVRPGTPDHLSDLAIDLLDPAVQPPSADVLSAHLSRLDGDREDTFFGATGPLGFQQQEYAGHPAPERRRSVSKLVIGVAVLLVLSLVGLFVTIQALSGSSHSPTNAPTGGSTSIAANPNGQPTPVPLSASQLRIVDPKGSRSELTGVDAMVDGNTSTNWHTEHYKGSPDFGGIKPGMGILVDLGAPKKVRGVKITFVSRGAVVELRRGTTLPPATTAGDNQILQTYEPLGGPQEAGLTTILNSDGAPVQYLLIWITKLPPIPDDQGYQVKIEEIQVTAD